MTEQAIPEHTPVYVCHYPTWYGWKTGDSVLEDVIVYVTPNYASFNPAGMPWSVRCVGLIDGKSVDHGICDMVSLQECKLYVDWLIEFRLHRTNLNFRQYKAHGCR